MREVFSVAGDEIPADLVWETVTCGCQIASKDGAMYMKPCDPGCEYYAFSLQETHRQGKLVEFKFQG